MKFTGLIFPTLAISILTACGSSSDSSKTEFTAFDLSGYQAVSDSGDLSGVWVGVGNYSGTSSEDGFDFTLKSSQKTVFSVFFNEQQELYGTDCNGVSEKVNLVDGKIVFEGNGLGNITNNNTISFQDEESGLNFNAIKINHSPNTIGSLTVEGPDNLEGIGSQLVLGLCQQSVETLTSSGYSSILLETEIAMADSLEASINLQEVSELDYSLFSVEGPNISEETGEELNYKTSLNDSFMYWNFDNENSLGDNIELNTIQDSQHVYQAEFFATPLAGGQGTIFQVSLEY